ncbi:MAG: DUF3352 domain-containing protein [Nocardioides sp.]
MSDYQPPSGAPEYLDSGSGSPFVPDPAGPAAETAPRRRRRTPWIVAILAVLLLGGGAAAWAVMSFFRQGAQPAEALPASTIAYVSVDLDPSGGQKIDAFRTLNKFPAFKDQVGVSSTDDVRRKIGQAFVSDLGCSAVTYADDVEPWLGDRAAFAAVDLGQNDPVPVVVVQSKDDGKARDALRAIAGCDHGQGEGYVVTDGWAVLAQSQAQADQVAAAAGKGTLADDATYQQWNDRLGDAGVVNMYAAPQAGVYLAGQLDRWSSLLTDPSSGFTSPQLMPSGSAALDPSGDLTRELRSFKGAAATIRFNSNGLELAAVSAANLPGSAGFVGDQAGAGVTRLPDDTAAAVGLSLQKGWLKTVLGRMSGALGAGMSSSRMTRQIEQSTGLRVPDDVEAMLGDSTTFAVGGDIDYEAVSNAGDGSHIPIGAVVKGNPSRIEPVLDKLRSDAAPLAELLGSDSSGDLVAIGPSADYRQQLLAGGHLGDTRAFQNVIPAPDHASEILFVDVDRFEKSIAEAAGSDPQTLDNVKPLEAFGFSAWVDGDLGHLTFRVSTH